MIRSVIMTPEERRLEIAVLRAAAVLYDYQTEVLAGRGHWPDGEPLPGVQLRWATEELAKYHGSTTHLQADLDQEEDYTGHSSVMTPEERAVIDAAYDWRCSSVHIRSDMFADRLTDAVDTLQAKIGQPNWILRTWADVRRGDTVRLPHYRQATTVIKDRYIPPAATKEEARAERGYWHVVPAPKHWDDHAVRPGECWVVFQGETEPRNMDPAKPVEIELTPAEVQAIEAIGWENRLTLDEMSTRLQP
jgi:hypothetical protein